jgi:SPP1 family phage portal protein
LKTYGRKTIYANYSETEILNASDEKQKEIVLDILKNSLSIHNTNRDETNYLKDYHKGLQDIYTEKKKITRTDIDNKTVENWAYAFIDFKKGWLLGKPIQYVQLSVDAEEELGFLNKYCRSRNKDAKDSLLFEDILIGGRGFRFITPVKNVEDGEAPFDVINVDSSLCEVVYSSQLGNEQLLSYVESSMKYIDTEDKNKEKYYSIYTVYLRNRKYVINCKRGMEITSVTPLIIGKHYITEYYINQNRISLIEIGKDLFNDINYLESLDKDDMEQFVNAIMVFTNAEVNEDDINAIRELGAVSISSTEGREAKIDLLEQRLNANTTNSYYTRLLNALHQILGIPKAGDGGEISYGDTGQARLTGQGFTSAGIRATNDEKMFAMCDMEAVKVILKICKEKNTKIKKLSSVDFEPRFNRDRNDNLLVKTQALMNLYSCDIPRGIANAQIGLFNDPTEVTNEQNKLFGKQVSQIASKTNTKDSANEQKNEITNVEQKNLQNS